MLRELELTGIITATKAPSLETVEESGRPASRAAAFDLIWTHDYEGCILSINSAACEALGMPAGLLIGKSILDFLPRDTASGIANYMETLRREGLAVGMMKVTSRAGRRQIWECRSTPDSEGVVRGVARDVTEREDALRAVRHSEEHFRSIIENVSDIIAIVELDGRLRYGSPSIGRVLGYSRADLFGMQAIDLIHPDDSGRAAAFLAHQMAVPAAIQGIELRARHRDGTWVSFDIVATNLVKNGQTSAIIVNARDISERKILETQLAQANRLGGLGRLAATVAHEFNNVLMGMQPFAELMQRPDATPQIISKGSWHIANSIKRGKRIVLDILRFAQPHIPERSVIDLNEWWKTFAPEAEAVLGNVISLLSAIPANLCVIADRSQLSQVLANLVANARDAMPGGGTLTVSANTLAPSTRFPFGAVPHPERFVQISVRDTGHGIPAEIVDRVFEPLFTTRPSGGTGLGLAVAHQVLAQNQGSIFVESAPGRGSTFHLFLPRGTKPLFVSAVIESPAQSLVAIRVLIVDDEAPIAEGIAALLEEDGIEVASVGTGKEAAGAIATFHPNIVLLDFGLPDMDGSEVYTRIRETKPLLPIIFSTGHGDRRRLLDDLNDPNVRFLQKPFEVDALLRMMAELERPHTP
ncbi:MAG: hypothetical protein QOK37_4117 [Thermoanaerobaculia bacterium]|jgi:PAS domain S-box-containing protein|nr:hypothetical protein [Thermoanaerobaculia bacterium]